MFEAGSSDPLASWDVLDAFWCIATIDFFEAIDLENLN
jgi:hypothetical protein